MEVDFRYSEERVMRVSDIRLRRGALDSPYLLIWILEGKVGDEWEYLMSFMPRNEEKILKHLKAFRDADYYYRCTGEVPVLQIEKDHEISLGEEVVKFKKELEKRGYMDY